MAAVCKARGAKGRAAREDPRDPSASEMRCSPGCAAASSRHNHRCASQLKKMVCECECQHYFDNDQRKQTSKNNGVQCGSFGTTRNAVIIFHKKLFSAARGPISIVSKTARRKQRFVYFRSTRDNARSFQRMTTRTISSSSSRRKRSQVAGRYSKNQKSDECVESHRDRSRIPEVQNTEFKDRICS